MPTTLAMAEAIVSTFPYIAILAIGVVFFVFSTIFFADQKWAKSSQRLIAQYSLLATFVMALFATIGSLLFSEVIGYEPCVLCWIQRIFIYPQVIILGIAMWKKDYSIVFYSLALSLAGGLVALYQSLAQFTGLSLTACTSAGGSCDKIFVRVWGFVTIPTMSLLVFVLMVLVMYIAYRQKNSLSAGHIDVLK